VEKLRSLGEEGWRSLKKGEIGESDDEQRTMDFLSVQL
jgi:hypothetical protein